MDQLKQYAPSIGGFLLGTAVNFSGYQNPSLAVVLTVIGAVMLAWPIMPQLREALASPVDGRRLLRAGIQPVVLLVIGAAIVTITLSMSPSPPPLTGLGWLLLYVSVLLSIGALWLIGASIWGRLANSSPPVNATIGKGGHWKQRSRLELHQIVARTVGLPGDTYEFKADPGNSLLRLLDDAIRKGDLKTVRGDVAKSGAEDGLMVQIEHADLLAFAKRENIEDLINLANEWRPPPPEPSFASRLQSGDIVIAYPPNPVQRDCWYKDAVFYIANRRWPEDAEQSSMFANEADLARAATAAAEMRQAAADGKLKVWGKPMRSTMYLTGDTSAGIYQEILPHHWIDYTVDAAELSHPPNAVFTTRNGELDDNSQCDLKTSRYQVVSNWKPK